MERKKTTQHNTNTNVLSKSIIGKFCLNILSIFLRTDETHDGDEKWFGLFIEFYFAVNSRKFLSVERKNNKNDLFSRHLVQFTVVRLL